MQLGIETRVKRIWKSTAPLLQNVEQKEERKIMLKDLKLERKFQKGVLKNYKDHPEVKAQKTRTRLLHYPEIFYGQQKFKNSRGEALRSKLEVLFSELLICNNINYIIEPKLRLVDGSYKIIDFVVDDIIIEISGYAHDKWRESFIKKAHLLRQSCSNQILILTYPKHHITSSWAKILYGDEKRSIYQVVFDQDMYCDNIYDSNRILEKLKFCERIIDSWKENLPEKYIKFDKGVNYFYGDY